MQTYPDSIGVDISKEHLDIRYQKISKRFPNTSSGHRRLIRWVHSLEKNIQIICESSGGYEKHLLASLWKAQIAVCRVNALHVRNFARASGQLAKTDSLDAEVLEQYGNVMHPRLTDPVSERQIKLAELVQRRQQFLETLQQEKNRVEHMGNKELIRGSNAFQKYIREHIKRIEKLIQNHLEQNDDLSQKVETLARVDGVGKITAQALVALMPELGKLSRRSIAALAGVAPMNRDSGKYQGKRSAHGGRPAIRKALYMPALVASRYNPVLSSLYSRLCAKGKPPKLALVAVMRKLIIHLNALLKQPQLQPA